MKNLHHDGRTDEGVDEQHTGIGIYPIADVVAKIVALANALEEDEVSKRCEGDATEEGDGIA